MNRAVYIIGYPASGKTTAVRSALNTLEPQLVVQPFKHMVYGNAITQLGYDREVYGGTDGLAFNVLPKVIEWLPACTTPILIGEGDRLANNAFFAAVQKQGRKLTIVHMKVGELIALRRMQRRGSQFNPIWVRRTMTKVDNLASKWRSNVIAIDGTRETESIGEELKELLYVE
jgi:tRNA uridine 5-carbamoylmethylation protein Kti12